MAVATMTGWAMSPLTLSRAQAAAVAQAVLSRGQVVFLCHALRADSEAWMSAQVSARLGESPGTVMTTGLAAEGVILAAAGVHPY